MVNKITSKLKYFSIKKRIFSPNTNINAPNKKNLALRLSVDAIINIKKFILNVPDDYLVGIVPGSDTGAIEIAMWNLLGSKPVTMLVWDSFGADWAKDIQVQLKLKDLDIVKVDY